MMGFVGLTVFAADYIPLAPIPGTVPEACNPLNPDAIKPGTDAYREKCTTYNDTAKQGGLAGYLTGLYKTGIAAAGILAVLMLVWGGFQYMTTEAVSGKSESKGIIMNVVWGLATVLASYLLLYTINPRLVDIGLALTPLNSVTKTRVPSAEESYGKFLDDALKRAQNISTKAREIHGDVVTAQNALARLQSNLDNGVYEDEDGNPLTETELQQKITDLQTKIGQLQTKETLVRNYKGAVDYLSISMRTQINRCLVGEGTCSVPTGLLDRLNPTNWTWIGGLPRVDYTIASKDRTANNAVVDKMLAAARAKVNSDKQQLEAAGLTAQAADLEERMKNIEDETAFQRRCPNSKTIYARGKGYESGPCPP